VVAISSRIAPAVSEGAIEVASKRDLLRNLVRPYRRNGSDGCTDDRKGCTNTNGRPPNSRDDHNAAMVADELSHAAADAEERMTNDVGPNRWIGPSVALIISSLLLYRSSISFPRLFRCRHARFPGTRFSSAPTHRVLHELATTWLRVEAT
jgi:hypothetical protein